jgi:hypothetical protein
VGTVISVLQRTDKWGARHDPEELCTWERAQVFRIMENATMEE